MNDIADSYRSFDWQEEEEHVGRIKCGGKRIASERMPAKAIWIPERDMSTHVRFFYEELKVIEVMNYIHTPQHISGTRCQCPPK